MNIPCQVSLRHVADGDRVRESVLEHVEQLARFCDRILHCRVMVEAPHPRHRTGNIHHVRIDITVPGREIVVKRDPPANQEREDLRIALREAFRSARRQLEDYVRERRHLVKTHEPAPHGRVLRMFPQDGYGFLESPDGQELYFHRDAVLGGTFEKLAPGDEVRFVEERGEKGPQASTAVPVGRHGGALPRPPARAAAPSQGAEEES